MLTAAAAAAVAGRLWASSSSWLLGCRSLLPLSTAPNPCLSLLNPHIQPPQDALAHGQPSDGIPLHTCACPPCFAAVEKGGKVTCEPKCDLQYCDLDVGLCHAQPHSGGWACLTLGARCSFVADACPS